MTEILDRFAIDALYHGNVDRNDADAAKNLVLKLVDESGGGGLPQKKFPTEPVTKIPPLLTQDSIILPSKNPTEPNTAVEIYFQVGKDNPEERVIIDLLSHMMYEPIYDQIRTKGQFGYEVSCDARWTNGVMGIHFRVVSSTKSAAETVERIDKFLMDYRTELSDMKDDDFMEHLVGLAKNKLDMHNSLSEESDSLWGEIRDGRHEWEHPRNEAVCLRSITKERVLASYDEWLLPTTDGYPRKRRMLSVQIIGSGEGPASLGRPEIDDSALGYHVDEAVQSYRKAIGNATWGKITFG
jgi:secreted Zn-dependent insulinase-like peptidase